MQKAYEKIQLQVEGMTCANCALGITRLLEQKGMDDVYVNFATGEVHFANAGDKQLPELVNGIESLGYKVVDFKTGKPNKGREQLADYERQLYFYRLLWDGSNQNKILSRGALDFVE